MMSECPTPKTQLPSADTGMSSIRLERPGMFSNEELSVRFTHHVPKPDQLDKYKWIRNMAHELASLMNDSAPPSRELALAITHLEDAVMWANAAIARRS